MTDTSAPEPKRRPWWRRVLKWFLSTIGILLLLVVALAIWVGATRSGLDFAWSLIGPRLPDGMAVATVEGRLVGPLTITGVKLDTDSMDVAVERLHLEWQFMDLLSATVHVEQLAVSGVRYTAKPTATQPQPEENGEPFTLPDAISLPLQVRLDELIVNDVRVKTAIAAQPLELTTARVQDTVLAAQQWQVGQLSAHGPLFDINAHAQLTPSGRYAATLVVEAQLKPPKLAPIEAAVNISGNLDKLAVSARVAAPYNVALDAKLGNIALDAPQDIHIDGTLALDDTRLTAIGDDLPPVPPITTQLHVSGTVAKLEVEQTVAAPYNASLDATLADVLATPSINAKLTLTNTQLTAIKQTLPPISLTTTINVAGAPDDLALQLQAQADSPQYGVINAHARLHYSPEAVAIKALTVTRAGSPMQLQASGAVALTQGRKMDMQLAWHDLQWPLAGAAAYSSQQGQFNISGTLQDYSVDGTMDWQVADQAAGKLQLAGTGDLQSFQLKQLQISGGPGAISATADVTWAPQLAVTAHVTGNHINPGAIVAGVPGDFALTVDVRAKQNEAGAIVAHVDTLTANGQLRGQSLRLDGQLAYLGDHVTINKLALDYGATQVAINGQAGWTPQAPVDLNWSIDAPQLAQLWPTLAGTLHTKGHVEGTVTAPLVDAQLAARGIEYGDYHVAAVDMNADVDWSGSTQSKVELAVNGVKAAGQDVQSLTLNVTGTPASHTAQLALDSSTAQLAVELRGGLAKNNKVWDFTLTALQVAYGELAPWTLAAPASGQVSADSQRIADACLTSGEARLCITGQHGGNGTTASLQLTDLAFAYAKPFLPDNLAVQGALSGRVEATLPSGGTPTVKLHLQTTAGQVIADKANGDSVSVLAFDPARVEATLADTALAASLTLPLNDTGNVQAQFAVAPGAGALTERPLTGELHVNVEKLDFVTRLVTEVSKVQGHIDGDMQISGTLAAPRVLGNIALNAKQLVLLSPGLALANVKLTARGSGKAIDLALSANSGGGTLSVDGAIDFADAGSSIDLAIKGKRFQIANTPIVRASISPDLDVAITPQAVRVTGTLEVPNARITPRDFPQGGVQTVASDAVIVSEKKQSVAEKAARSITADIKVVLGDVRIDGFGLKTGIQGTLEVQQAPGELVTAAGKLSLVDGSYRAYGQNLDIQSGRIYFSGGPIANPGFELRAARYPAEDVTVGVEVRGSINKPELTLFSKPTMSQAEILSWLLLGRPLNGTTAGQDNLIAKAALALGSGRANKVLDNLGDALGLDDIGLGSAAGHGTGEAAFMIGKYLTPRLYVSYGVGLFSSVSTLSLRYTLNSHWKLEGDSSSEGTGADIIYTFDR